MSKKEILKLGNINLHHPKYYPLLHADITIYSDEITGLLGLHDSGISTLIELFSGELFTRDIRCFYREQVVSLSEIQNKSFVLRKRSSLTPNQTILENIFYISKERPYRLWTHEKKCQKELLFLLRKLNLSLDIMKRTSELTNPERIIVECLKAITLKKEFIIFEDVFSSLSYDQMETIQDFLLRITHTYPFINIILTANQSHYIHQLAQSITFMAKGHNIYETPNVYSQENYDSILSSGKIKNLNKVNSPKSSPADYVFQHADLYLYRNEMTILLDPFFVLRNPIKELILNQKQTDSVFLSFNVNEQIIENLSVIDNLILQKPKNFTKGGFIHRKRLTALKNDFCDWCKERKINYDFINSSHCYNLSPFEKMSVYLFKCSLLRKQILFIADPLLYFDINMASLVLGEIDLWQKGGATICIFASEMRDVYRSADRVLQVKKDGTI
ncbi:ABC-type sugar transport system ATPase subunit [Aequitasia blattaphilus]|uniref:ABC transporter domain-containing protein n=1 Tax=Aequitasia blattaphilus TaxID=2949332 RepID=A0ABT1EDW3_9FIRM|nr:hypothetical protein [Aequitasia blattaphilus]MCP1103026.1 hypothetical protein [Aequitasia blattaphilus]MCR8615666.1 hypothetical protein [Aequitasia blattaphilus]